jgi:MFS family permease
MVVVSNFIDTPYSGVVLPVYFQRFFGSAVPLGLVLSASGAGALITALAFGAVGHRLSRRAVYFGGFLLATTRFFVFALVPPIWALVLISLITGLGSGPINPVISTISYERIPPHYRGRVLGSLTSLAFIAMPLGSVLGGLALQTFDIRAILVTLGVLYVATILISMAAPAMRHMDMRPSTAASPNSQVEG